jgi:hypothetical protein
MPRCSQRIGGALKSSPGSEGDRQMADKKIQPKAPEVASVDSDKAAARVTKTSAKKMHAKKMHAKKTHAKKMHAKKMHAKKMHG